MLNNETPKIIHQAVIICTSVNLVSPTVLILNKINMKKWKTTMQLGFAI